MRLDQRKDTEGAARRTRIRRRTRICRRTKIRRRGAAPAIARLRPSDSLGAFFTIFGVVLTVGSLVLSNSSGIGIWFCGQLLLSMALLQWFAILHEAGHKTLFRSSAANRLVGHLAGFFALIPLPCWRIVHSRHHRWTGWQDLDTTTASLVPRELRRWERLVVNLCWFTGFPLFSILYRVNNYWNLPRLFKWFDDPSIRRELRRSVTAYGLLYLTVLAAAVLWLGPMTLIRICGAGLLMTLIMQDPLILSQHTHIPMKLAGGGDVRPFTAEQQEQFTRSLRFPRWFSWLVLLNLDAHELHHVYPSVPGYRLHELRRETRNSIAWWRWLLQAKSVRGDVLLFQNRDATGHTF